MTRTYYLKNVQAQARIKPIQVNEEHTFLPSEQKLFPSRQLEAEASALVRQSQHDGFDLHKLVDPSKDITVQYHCQLARISREDIKLSSIFTYSRTFAKTSNYGTLFLLRTLFESDVKLP